MKNWCGKRSKYSNVIPVYSVYYVHWQIWLICIFLRISLMEDLPPCPPAPNRHCFDDNNVKSRIFWFYCAQEWLRTYTASNSIFPKYFKMWKSFIVFYSLSEQSFYLSPQKVWIYIRFYFIKSFKRPVRKLRGFRKKTITNPQQWPHSIALELINCQSVKCHIWVQTWNLSQASQAVLV